MIRGRSAACGCNQIVKINLIWKLHQLYRMRSLSESWLHIYTCFNLKCIIYISVINTCLCNDQNLIISRIRDLHESYNMSRQRILFHHQAWEFIEIHNKRCVCEDLYFKSYVHISNKSLFLRITLFPPIKEPAYLLL